MHTEKKREHIVGGCCWCNPTLEYISPKTGAEVWVHNDIDTDVIDRVSNLFDGIDNDR